MYLNNNDSEESVFFNLPTLPFIKKKVKTIFTLQIECFYTTSITHIFKKTLQIETFLLVLINTTRPQKGVFKT